MGWLTDIVVVLNTGANALGRTLAPIGWLPGWLSITLVSVITGIGLLLIFKYTSNQRAIKGVRRSIRANRLTGSLFRDRVALGFRAQGCALLGGARLLLLNIVPMLVMSIPVALLLCQLSVWYQAKPLRVGEETTVTLKLNGDIGEPMPAVILEPTSAVEDTAGPARVFNQREVCWNLIAREPGLHRLRFSIEGQTFEKEIAIGDGFMPVSPLRPSWDWFDAMEYPREKPFGRDSVVQSIAIEYATRSGWASGANNWIIYWFAVSLIAGFLLRHRLGVNL